MIYLAICAMGLAWEVNLVGRLTFADILLVAALPVLIATKRASRLTPLVIQFYIFLLFWFLGAVATDAYRSTPIEDLYRGWAKIAFLGLNFTAMWLFAQNSRGKMIAFVFLLLVASAIRIKTQPTNEFGDVLFDDGLFGNAWKFGYGQLVAGAALLVSARLLNNPITKMYGVILPFADAALNLALNARNLFGLTAISALVVLLTFGRRRPASAPQLAIYAMLAIALGWGSTSAYTYAAGSGMLGIDAQEKYELQASGSLGLLIGGRTESLASTQAIIDSPILGHGSWARDKYYVDLMLSRLEQAGYEIRGGDSEDDLIPSHSHLFGAWVEAGILGAFFWGWAVYVAIRGIYGAIQRPEPFTGFVVFIGLSLLWDIFFSPFGLERHVITPAWLLLMMLYAETSKKEGRSIGA